MELRPQITDIYKQQTLDPLLHHLYINHHIAHHAVSKPILLRITPFFLINRDDKTYRKEVERHFIRKLHPELNQD